MANDIFLTIKFSDTCISYFMEYTTCCQPIRKFYFYFRDRLVYPPSLALITIGLGYISVYQIIRIPNPQLNFAFWIGFLVGYLAYDSTHYFLHHVDTTKHKGTYFHSLQKYHNQHHYGGEDRGFGVSSKFWDIVFRTEMTKRKVH